MLEFEIRKGAIMQKKRLFQSLALFLSLLLALPALAGCGDAAVSYTHLKPLVAVYPRLERSFLHAPLRFRFDFWLAFQRS